MNRIDAPDLNVRSPHAFFAFARNNGFDVRAKDGVTEIDLYDEIGFFGVSAQDFRRELKAVDTPRVKLSINSPGGSVFDGIAMFNDLLDHPATVEVRVSGLAASAASIVAMAGDRIEMAENGFMMIHNAWSIGMGNAEEFRDLADRLAAIDGALVRTYEERTGRDDIADLMAAETWMDGAKAVEMGFADAVTGQEDAKARFDLSVFRNVPGDLRMTVRESERTLREAGLSRSDAKRLAPAINGEAQRDADAGPLLAQLQGVRQMLESIR